MNNPKEIADLIINLLKKKGVSANKMLQDCQLKTSLIDNIKRGKMPSADKLLIIAQYLGVSIDYLLGTTDNPAPASEKTASDYGISEADYKLLQNVKFAFYGKTDKDFTERDMQDLLTLVKAAQKINEQKEQ